MNLLAKDELSTKLGDLGVVQSTEDSLKYAARMAARESKAGKLGGKFKDPEMAHPKLTPYAVSSPSSLSLMSPATNFSDHGPGHAVSASTLAPLRTSALPFANYELAVPSFVFAATAASISIDIVPNPPGHAAQPSPPSIQPNILEERAHAERAARERIARMLSDYLAAHPEPIIGSIDNPFPSLDKYGVKGLSVLSIFFDHLDADTFTCYLCSDKRDSIDDALDHQRTARHG